MLGVYRIRKTVSVGIRRREEVRLEGKGVVLVRFTNLYNYFFYMSAKYVNTSIENTNLNKKKKFFLKVPNIAKN